MQCRPNKRWLLTNPLTYLHLCQWCSWRFLRPCDQGCHKHGSAWLLTCQIWWRCGCILCQILARSSMRTSCFWRSLWCCVQFTPWPFCVTWTAWNESDLKLVLLWLCRRCMLTCNTWSWDWMRNFMLVPLEMSPRSPRRRTRRRTFRRLTLLHCWFQVSIRCKASWYVDALTFCFFEN